MGPRRGFKVTDAERKVRVGIAVETIADLRKKTLEKFKLDILEADISFQTRDGLPVDTDEDFDTLAPQTLLIWVKRGQKAETDAEILYRTIREVNMDFLTTGERVHEFFTEQMKSKVYRLAEVLKELEDSRARMSGKEEDKEWFKGIDSRAKTKEEYMFRRSQDRIRGYYYKTKDEVLRTSLPRDLLQQLTLELQKRLQDVKFFGSYFDRRHTADPKLCDPSGTFACQGRWDKEICLYSNHTINPYRSREDRIVFQTWNLDHKIERCRAIIPAVCKAMEKQTMATEKGVKCKVNVEVVFNDLFTLSNLKLVHIVCHDKGVHDKIDYERYLID